MVFTLQWKLDCFFSLSPLAPLASEVFYPPTLWWNIDVKSLESWVSHLSRWYHKAAINSVTEHQTYHRHIIGSEDITESSCLKINRAFPGGRPLVDSQRHLQSPSTSLLGLRSPLLFFLSHPGQFKMAFCFPISFFFPFFFLRWLCKYANTLDLCIITSSGTICCWLVDLPCVCFLMVFSCVWVMYWCINNVIII